jgi:hypothetical protein
MGCNSSKQECVLLTDVVTCIEHTNLILVEICSKSSNVYSEPGKIDLFISKIKPLMTGINDVISSYNERNKKNDTKELHKQIILLIEKTKTLQSMIIMLHNFIGNTKLLKLL